MSAAYDQLFTILGTFYPLSKELKQALIKNTKEIFLPKHTALFDIGEVASISYFVYKGMARTYYYKNEKEVTNNLCPENRIFISASSFYTGIPSYEAGVLVEDSQLIEITQIAIEKLCHEYLELNFMIRKLVEMFYVVLDQRTYFLHMKDVAERYNQLLESNPDFFLRVPLGQIASFLGMTQETLSRLRAQNGKS